jgi:hypothetical protein
METKSHIFDLLGRQQNAESGRFREELLRSFLSKLLSTSVSVDTGFIYGFEQVETSKQLDIIIWAPRCIKGKTEGSDLNSGG